MEQIIRFRKGIDCLNDEEYQECITSFKDNLLSILFNAFCNELKEDKMDNINKINEIITKIIRSRKIKSMINDDGDEEDEDIDIAVNDKNEDLNDNEDAEKIQDIKLDELPSDILPKIAWYLQFDERIQFERTNRSIFIDSRSSKVAIHPLHQNQFKKLMEFYNDNSNDRNLPKLRIFKSLEMSTFDMVEFDKKTDSFVLKYKWNNFIIRL